MSGNKRISIQKLKTHLDRSKNSAVSPGLNPHKASVLGMQKLKVPSFNNRRMSSVIGDIGLNKLSFPVLHKINSKHNSSKLSLHKNQSIESYFSMKNNEASKKEESKLIVGNDGLPIVNEKSISTSSTGSGPPRNRKRRKRHRSKVK